MAGNTFNLTGPHSRVNIHSHDQSTNVMAERTENVFVELRQAIESGVEAQDIRAQILSALVDLEQARGTNNFLKKYQMFIASAANHMTLIAPFIPALTQMLGAG